MAAPNFSDFQTISIDFDVYKALTANLKDPSDSYNEVVRRLLSLPPIPSTAGSESAAGAGSWIVKGVTFPHGTEFRAKFKGQDYNARVEDGALVYNCQRYYSPSAPAMAITDSSVNGWNFWQCRLPGRMWVGIDSLRRK